jgi:photosystem II stability/assembly factor-like uncharacterized protein
MSAEYSSSPAARAKLLNWPWLYGALCLFIVSTIFAWMQEPTPVPQNRGRTPGSFFDVRESNPHRRLVSVLDDLNWVYFARGGARGWAVGAHGRILTTNDGGSNWRNQESPTNEALTKIIFQSDGLHGWAGTDYRTLVVTNDGGEHWKASEEAWADVGANSTLDTSFGTFRRVILSDANPAAKPGPEGAFDFKPQLPPWPLADDGTVRGSATKNSAVPLQGGYGRIHVVAGHVDSSNRLAWAVGKLGAIIATEDGGQTWHPQTSTTQPSLAGLWIAPDGTHAWAVGSEGTILASANGGRSWAQQPSGTRDALRTVRFLKDGLQGWAGGESGTILVTEDGGKTWKKEQFIDETLTIDELWPSPDGHLIAVATNVDTIKFAFENVNGKAWVSSNILGKGPDLQSVDFSPDGRTGWAILGTISTLMKSSDKGVKWSSGKSSNSLLSVSFGGANGLHGVAIADQDVAAAAVPMWSLMTSDDGGNTWQVHEDLRHLRPYKVKLANDGLHGLALASGGNILATDDGGLHWRQAEAYSRSVAPWYWLAALLSAGLAWMTWRLRPAPNADDESVKDIVTSDAEVREPDDDRLQFRGLARGISRFLRNAETQPPLTLAITGDWGSGKSSLMRLVCADIRRYGICPIWFNAWHHQKEEHLFAALLGAIYGQAAPPLFSMSGLSFRLRLLWLRSWRHFGVMMLVVALVTCLLLLSVRVFETGGVSNVTASIITLREIAERPLGALAALSAALTALLGIVKGTTVFRANPALLLGKAREHMSLKAAAAQNDFRDQFAKQFDELTKALPYRLVIVIDDLDRCKAASVIDVMEAVNYLTSAGKCIVIFGMATERVTAALGLAFKDIAAELLHFEGGTEPGATASTQGAAPEIAKRHAYASDYLQKLINIEIKVPAAESKNPHELLLTTEPEQRRRVTLFLKELATLWPLAAASVAVAIGMWMAGEAGEMLKQAPSANPLAQHADTKSMSSTAKGATDVSRTPAAPVQGQTQVRARPAVNPVESQPFQVAPGEVASWRTNAAGVVLALLPLLAIAGQITLLLLRKTLYETRDSAKFKGALEIWTPIVATKRNTPRAIKRFGNRLRYLAMLQQGERQDQTPLDLLQDRLKRLIQKNGAADSASGGWQPALSEHQLIALGALYEVLGVDWKEKMAKIFSSNSTALSQSLKFVTQLKAAAQEHQNKFDTLWPPSEAEIEVFERLIAGIRLSGDRQVITRSKERHRKQAKLKPEVAAYSSTA